VTATAEIVVVHGTLADLSRCSTEGLTSANTMKTQPAGAPRSRGCGALVQLFNDEQHPLPRPEFLGDLPAADGDVSGLGLLQRLFLMSVAASLVCDDDEGG
jgi:hypothetical protein